VKAATFAVIAAAFILLVPSAFAGTNNPATQALMLRGDALNQRYHLGVYQSSAASPAAVHALMERSAALNERYHLGTYGQTSPASRANAIHALMARGVGLNRQYHLGSYASASGTSSATDSGPVPAWAFIGIVGAIVVLLLAYGSRVVRRSTVRVKAS